MQTITTEQQQHRTPANHPLSNTPLAVRLVYVSNLGDQGVIGIGIRQE